ncbi:MAG: hypothetical protein PVJ39_07410 [Gammaproteobacteria bacterium]|jgi:hypothetical protein
MSKIGNWVTSYTAGYWKLVKIIDPFYVDRKDLKEEKRLKEDQIAIVARICTENFKRSFKTESCSIGFIEALDDEQVKKINAFLSENPKILKAFENYKIKNLNHTQSIDFALPQNMSDEWFSEIANKILERVIESGLTNDEVLRKIENTELKKYKCEYPISPTNSIILVGDNFELKDKELLYRSYNLFNSETGRKLNEKYETPNDEAPKFEQFVNHVLKEKT